MELKVEIGFDELLWAVKQLPAEQRDILAKEISKQKVELAKKNQNFKDFLLAGPFMTDEHYEEVKEARKTINKWRSK